MQNNRAFWKALHSLTHPLSVASILLLLINDHWLRYQHPSWLTGKLGDFTWLLFAPFIMALVISWLIPHKLKIQTKLVGILSISFIGIWFATAKTIPAIHGLTTDSLAFLVGYRGTLRMDVTDLLTLPALLMSAYIWVNARDESLNTKPIGYALFGLAILGTMASDSPQYRNTAIETICELDSGYLVTSDTSSTDYMNRETTRYYESTNGGFSWREQSNLEMGGRCSDEFETSTTHPNNSDIIYRWERDHYVEKSTDDGDTWIRIHELTELDQDVREYGNQDPINDVYDPDTIIYEPSPVSGLVHAETGNLLLAMSGDGVLVITPDNQSTWVAVGQFQLDDLRDVNLLSDALIAHRFLLPTLWLLIMVSTITFIHSKRVITKSILVIGWIHWALLVGFSHKVFELVNATYTDILSDYAYMWGLSALFSAVFIAFPFVLWAGYNLFARYGRAVVPIMMTCLVATLAYALAIGMWTQGLIPRYYVAGFFAVLLVGCVLASCYTYYRDSLPNRYEIEKPKRKEKPTMAK